MIEVVYRGIRIQLCFSFFAVAAASVLISGDISPALAACLLHESGHIAAMLLCRAKPRRIVFYGAGIMLVPCRELLPARYELMILSAGCAVNFLLFLTDTLLYGHIGVFGLTNLLLAIFNMLPCPALDGGRISEFLLEQHLDPRTAHSICRAAGILSCLIFTGILILFHAVSITALTALVLMMISSLMF